MRNVSDKSCREIKTHILRSITKNWCHLWDNVEKYCTAGQVTDDNKAHCMLGTYGYKQTLRTCNNYCFSTAATVSRTRPNVTLYVPRLTCLYSFEPNSGFWHYPKLERDRFLSHPFQFLNAGNSLNKSQQNKDTQKQQYAQCRHCLLHCNTVKQCISSNKWSVIFLRLFPLTCQAARPTRDMWPPRAG
jgi:hypothetical protein